MNDIISRDYCLKNPRKIISLFGLGVFLGMFFSKKKSLLQRVTEAYERNGIAMPGSVGHAYKLSAIIEYRMSRIYSRMADRFSDHPEVHALFQELQQEEEAHTRLMMMCLYSVVMDENLQFVPSIRDPEIKDILKRLKETEFSIDSMLLDEALDLTVELEQGEINTIFGKLLKQVQQEDCLLFKGEMGHLEEHGKSVPRRIEALRTITGS